MHSIGLLRLMCVLPYEIHTVDFVAAELINEGQKQAFNKLVNKGKIIVDSFTAEEVLEIVAEHSSVSGNLSIPDCSVCYYAKKHGVPMLTGDRRLRHHAEQLSTEVHGKLFPFDEMVANSVIASAEAADKLAALMALNSRLPQAAIRERIDKWRSL